MQIYIKYIKVRKWLKLKIENPKTKFSKIYNTDQYNFILMKLLKQLR